jgi:hypothetical protein
VLLGHRPLARLVVGEGAFGIGYGESVTVPDRGQTADIGEFARAAGGLGGAAGFYKVVFTKGRGTGAAGGAASISAVRMRWGWGTSGRRSSSGWSRGRVSSGVTGYGMGGEGGAEVREVALRIPGAGFGGCGSFGIDPNAFGRRRCGVLQGGQGLQSGGEGLYGAGVRGWQCIPDQP